MHLREGVDTAGATDEDLAVVFGVEVDKTLGLQHTVLQFHRTGESCLLIHRKEALDRGVLQFGVGDSGKGHRDTYTVIGAEGSTLCFQPFTVDPGLDRIFEEVVLHVSVFLCDHVHVGLQNDAFMVFVARRRGYAHDDVHGFVGHTLDTVRSSEIAQPFTDLFLVFRGARHFADLRENVKNSLGVHMIVVLVVY